jgi:hypothetical protein
LIICAGSKNCALARALARIGVPAPSSCARATFHQTSRPKNKQLKTSPFVPLSSAAAAAEQAGPFRNKKRAGPIPFFRPRAKRASISDKASKSRHIYELILHVGRPLRAGCAAAVAAAADVAPDEWCRACDIEPQRSRLTATVAGPRPVGFASRAVPPTRPEGRARAPVSRCPGQRYSRERANVAAHQARHSPPLSGPAGQQRASRQAPPDARLHNKWCRPAGAIFQSHGRGPLGSAQFFIAHGRCASCRRYDRRSLDERTDSYRRSAGGGGGGGPRQRASAAPWSPAAVRQADAPEVACQFN